jgi:hypothetical protein
MENKKFLKHLKKGINYSVVGSLGLVVVGALSGCGEKKEDDKQVFSQVAEAKNAFFVIEEKPKGSFKVIEQHPTTGPTRAILRDADGNEKMISEAELKKLAEEEAKKVEAGTSNLTNGNLEQGGGMSFGEALLAGAMGGMLGSLVGNAIANKMSNNQNFQQAQRQASKGRTTISRPATSAGSTSKTTTTSKPKSGYFGSSSTTSKSSTTSSTSTYGG